jgi:hypothetical protein
MQVDLRRVHRRIWPLLALVLVAGFLAAVLLRPTLPVETTPLPNLKSSQIPVTPPIPVVGRAG